MCGKKALLVITRTAEGTSTHVARLRIELSCRLPAGHGDAHHDTEHDEHWEDTKSQPVMIVRHEDEVAN